MGTVGRKVRCCLGNRRRKGLGNHLISLGWALTVVGASNPDLKAFPDVVQVVPQVLSLRFVVVLNAGSLLPGLVVDGGVQLVVRLKDLGGESGGALHGGQRRFDSLERFKVLLRCCL